MMDRERLEIILKKLGDLRIAVVGDYCLDEYLYIDPEKNEPSLETGLVAYQAVRKESTPGAAGTIAKNLINLGVKTVYAVGYIGDDGRGYEIGCALRDRGINSDHLIRAAGRTTPAYTKPWIMGEGTIREMNRIDIKNWTETPPELENDILAQINAAAQKVDAIIVLDQMTEKNCGVITDKVGEALCEIAGSRRDLIVYADSRSRIARFHDVIIKGNQYEIVKAVMGEAADADDMKNVLSCCATFSRKNGGKPIAVTLGERGSLIISGDSRTEIPAFPVDGQIDVCGAGDSFTTGFVSALSAGADLAEAGQIDVCGAGDSFTTGFVSALSAGADLAEAGLIGNIAASICISQLGSTGYVTPEQILHRFDSR